MKRGVVLAALLLGLLIPALASAHPLGNFTSNTYVRVEPSGGEVYVRYVVDLAEIPTLRERSRVDAAGGLTGYATEQARAFARRLDVLVSGRRLTLVPASHDAAFNRGAAGLDTLRIAVWYRTRGPVAAGPGEVRDGNFAGRRGWHELVVRASSGARVDSATVPAGDVTNELRTYPAGLTASPLDVRQARFTLTPGTGQGDVDLSGSGAAKIADHGFLSGLAEQNLSVGVVLLALLLAMGWGALHALSPGHGKSMVAAYLVGSRGTARHAFILGAFVTVTHIFSVIALGLLTLWASELILPETVFAWVNLLTAVFVVCIGLWVVWLRLRARRSQQAARQAHDHGHADGHDHPHDGHSHDPGHGHSHHYHDHDDDHHHHGGGHGHSHAPPADLSVRALAAAGVSAGLLPCPSAMVLMLGAISLGRTAYGLVLVVAFSLGLAIVLSSIGLLFLYARRFMDRLPLGGRIASAIPVVSAVVIVVLGLMLTVRAVPALT